MMKQAFLALKGGDLGSKSIFRTEVQAFEKVAKDEARELSTVQES